MIINARGNNFRFELPKIFFSENIRKKYEPIINRLPTPWKTLEKYINASIQSVELPTFSIQPVTQVNLHAPNIPWKGKGNIEYNISKELTVTFKLNEGFLNYLIMLDQLNEYYSYDVEKIPMPDFYIIFMDNQGFETFAFVLKRILYYEISSLSVSFSSLVPEYKTFSCKFIFTNFNISINYKNEE